MYSVGVCSDPILVSTDTIRMTVVNIQVTPVADISSEPADPLPGQLVTFEAKVVNGGYLPLYQWKRNGQDVIGATHAKWSANNLHPYDKISCVITSTDACASPKVAYSDTIMVGFPTEINDVAGGNVLRLYPNPNDGRFSLLVPHHLVTGRSMAVSIVNALGQVVYNKRFGSAGAIQQTGSNNGDYLLPISMNGLANGVYMLRLTTGEQEHHLRFTLGR